MQPDGSMLTLLDLANHSVGGDTIHCVYCHEDDTWYEPLLKGRGLDKWAARITAGVALLTPPVADPEP
jgi:hypothetical protein